MSAECAKVPYPIDMRCYKRHALIYLNFAIKNIRNARPLLSPPSTILNSEQLPEILLILLRTRLNKEGHILRI